MVAMVQSGGLLLALCPLVVSAVTKSFHVVQTSLNS